jgi:hypothetical protein
MVMIRKYNVAGKIRLLVHLLAARYTDCMRRSFMAFIVIFVVKAIHRA